MDLTVAPFGATGKTLALAQPTSKHDQQADNEVKKQRVAQIKMDEVAH